MKNALYSILFVAFAMPLWSQATQEDLQGTWKLVTYTTTEVILDLKTGKVKPTVFAKNTLAEPANRYYQEEAMALSKMLKSSYLEIKGEKFSLFIEDELRNGSFVITRNEKNVPVITATYEDQTRSTVPLIVEDGKIIIKQRYTGRVFTYEKEIK